MCIRDRVFRQELAVKAEEKRKLELERAAAIAKELADGLMEEESTAQNKGSQKQAQKQGKKKKVGPEEQEKRRKEKEKQRLEQEAQAKKKAEEQRIEALDMAREQKRLKDEQYDMMLAEERQRREAIQLEERRAEEARKAKQAVKQAKFAEEERQRQAEERAMRERDRANGMTQDVGDCAIAPGEWQCDVCTFVNAEADSQCAMCGQKSAHATPVSMSVGSLGSEPLTMPVEDDQGGEWHSVNTAKEEKKLKAEKRAVTDEDVQQELGNIVAENLASFEQVGEMATHLTDVEPWLAQDVITKLAVKLKEGALNEEACWGAFQQLLEAAGIAFRSSKASEQPAEVIAEAELQRVPSTPRTPGTLAAERATMGLSNAVGERNCFLNVVIQSLWHLQGFRQKFLMTCDECMSNESTTPGNAQSEAVLSALYNVFTAYNAALEGDSCERVVESTSLREALSKVNDDKFQMGLMDDAAEAHEAVLECLENSWAGSVTNSVFSLELLDHSQVKPLMYKAKVHYIAAAAIRDYVDSARNVSNKRRFHTVLKHVLQDQYGTHPAAAPAEDAFPLPLQQPAANNTNKKGKGKGKGKAPREADRHAPLELKNFPEVFTLGISWESGTESPENIKRVVDSMDEVLNLATVFSHVSSRARISKGNNAEKRCRMRGMICYYGRHFCSFMREGATENWLVLDDTMVKPVGVFADVVHKCYKGALQPCLIFYEAELRPKQNKTTVPEQSKPQVTRTEERPVRQANLRVPEPKPLATDKIPKPADPVAIPLPEPKPER
eukprot:TRINITY_DN8834_c0_g1_i5.p1 TRINITY_DN8834_c0_g1~~TRINITY_DN8834_c0_g1_i5.p1  ORF type:complete len:782 (-),score=256.04 TRINITY_DN8834_c0_g1_i5:220-2565(-)